MSAIHPSSGLQGPPLPIVLIGAGGIVRNAHLPAYRKGGLPVAAIVDHHPERAQALAAEWGIAMRGATLASVLPRLPGRVIFDVAVPAAAVLEVLPAIPQGSIVLIQKPLGGTLAEAEAIVALCRERGLRAAVNFQLRWAPNMLAARAITDAGALGTLHDIEVQVSTHTPWELWSFLKTAPRLEIVYHSIHYVDLVRSWLGNPQRVYARTVRNPRTPELAATKSVIVMDYDEWTRVFIATNHCLDVPYPELQHSYVQWEGTAGVMRAQMGVNLDYPKGRGDTLEFYPRGPQGAFAAGVQPVTGDWFPDAFLGSMLSVQRFALGETDTMPTHVDDALDTMRVVEAAYRSSERGGEPLPLVQVKTAQ
ncbi:MAG TPA: Gfo/Idh/MocA family oxidoreductase [Acidobacteriaceae bacterium]